MTLNDDEIKSTMYNLEQKELKVSSHLYKRFPGRLIGEVSDTFSNEYSNEAKERPGLVLLSVVLAAHRNYTKQVEPQIDRIRRMDFYSFEDLIQKTKSFNEFTILTGMKDLEKYTIIIELINVINKLKTHSGIVNDYSVMEKWALKSNHINFKEDIIGGIKGIGIATFQHLRMNFGANTIKPDQRVKEVLNQEFKFYADNDIEYISAVEYIAKIIGKSALYVDQVFVNYGSGYYINKNNREDEVDNKENQQRYINKPVIANSKRNKMKNSVEEMAEYIKETVKNLDVFIEKRGDGGCIVVAKVLSHKKRGKNVVTYWMTSNSISVIILQVLERTTFYSLNDMKNAEIAEKIEAKYNQMVY